jgi:hypothetical protein
MLYVANALVRWNTKRGISFLNEDHHCQQSIANLNERPNSMVSTDAINKKFAFTLHQKSSSECLISYLNLNGIRKGKRKIKKEGAVKEMH